MRIELCVGVQEAAEQLVDGRTSFLGAALLVFGWWLLRATLPLLERTFLNAPLSSARPHWRGPDLALVAGVIFIAMQLAFFGLGMLLEPSVLDGLLATDIGLLLGGGFAVAVALARSRQADPGAASGSALHDGLEAMGCAAEQSPGVLRASLFGGLGLVLAVPGIVGTMLLTPFVLSLFGREQVPQEVLVDLLSLRGPGLIAGLAMATLVGPALEELLFRGFVQPLAVHRVGAVRGVVLTSVVFALIHGFDAFLPVFVLSLVLGFVRHRSGHLMSSVVAHCLWNAGTMFVALS